VDVENKGAVGVRRRPSNWTCPVRCRQNEPGVCERTGVLVMKSIASIAAVLALAGTAIGQVDNAMPIQIGDPIMIVETEAANVIRGMARQPSIEDGLDGNSYTVNQWVGDDLVIMNMSSTNATFVSAGQASSFPLNFTGISGARSIFYNDQDPIWADTAMAPANVTSASDPTDGFNGILTMDSDVQAGDTHTIVFRIWFNSNGASVRPFAQPSLPGEPMFTPTILGDNDLIPDIERHPVLLGMDIGDVLGAGLQPPAGRAWVENSAIATQFSFLGFRNIDGAFVGVGFGVFPTVEVDANGDLVVGFLGIEPASLELNPDSFLPDLSSGLGPIAWGDGITDSLLVYALQYTIVVDSEDAGGPGACLGDIADDFGFTAADGGGPDGVVDFGDFVALLGLIGPCPGGTPGCLGDIADDFGFTAADGGGPDGQVDFGDFVALLGLIGPCP